MASFTTPMPSCLLTDEEKDHIQNAKESSSYNCIGQNFMQGRFGKFINTMKIEYLTCTGNDQDKKDDIALMLETFNYSKEIHL